METKIDGHGVWSRLVARWQPILLVSACIAGGMTLTTMVIGSTPSVMVEAPPAPAEAASAATPPSAPTSVAETTAPTDSVEAADTLAREEPPAPVPAPAAALVPDVVTEPILPVAIPVAGPTPTIAASPADEAVPSAPVAASPTTSAPAPAAVVTPVATAPVVTSAPVATAPAVPSTIAPSTVAPSTVAPSTVATTTAPPAVALTYPSYAAGSAGSVTLQFDGSSIYVASVAREPNWVAQIDKNGPRSVEVKFFNTATERDSEFHATVEDGRIKVEN